MKSNVDKSLDPLLQLFWRSMFTITLICPGVGLIVGICKQSLVAGILAYFLLLFMWTALVVYKLCQLTDPEYDDYLNIGMIGLGVLCFSILVLI